MDNSKKYIEITLIILVIVILAVLTSLLYSYASGKKLNGSNQHVNSSSDSTALASSTITYETKSFDYKSEGKSAYSIKIEYPQITSGLGDEVKLKINKAIEDYVLKDASSTKDLVGKNPTNEPEGGTARSNYHQVKSKLVYDLNRAHVLNVVFSSEDYFGGAHSEHLTSTLVFNTETGELITLDNFNKNSLEAIASLSNVELQKIGEAKPDCVYSADSLLKSGLNPKNKDNFKAFMFESDGMHVVFQEYQVGPYSCGTQHVVLSYADLVKKNVLPGDLIKLLNLSNIASNAHNTTTTEVIDITSKWSTFVSAENGFSIDYPTTWQGQQKDNVVGFEPKSTPNDTVADEMYYGNWKIVVKDDTSTLGEILGEFGLNGGTRTDKSITINGNPATLITYKSADNTELSSAVYLKKSKKEFVIIGSDNTSDAQAFQKFYSSFKFLK